MLATGSKIGPYTVEREIGRGGMGVVYLAGDSRLGRKVAIKALPAEVTGEAGRAARFEREARLLAGLSHPNIAVVYGLEEHAGARYLVLEYLEGTTLAARLARGGLDLRGALAIGAQVAAAVDAAHQAGVIHRDLKPANVMITPSGAAKVLDFGLAKEEPPGPGAVTATTASVPTPGAHTDPGVAMGTPGYLSPEQARGEAVDKRTDVFAFGCILFEALSGKRAFPGQSSAVALGALLHTDPDWGALPERTPGPVVRLLKRCLAKDRERRQRDMADVRLELEESLVEAPGSQAAPAVRAEAGAASSTTAIARRALIKRFAVPYPDGRVHTDIANLCLALAPDGSSMAFTAQDEGGWHVWVRPLDRLAPRRLIPGLAWCLFYSPDSQWLAFCAGGELRKRRAEGGPVLTVCTSRGVAGACWDADGFMYITPYWAKGVARVAERGGAFTFITERSLQELTHIYPCKVPGTDWLLFAVLCGGGRTASRIDAVHLSTSQRHTVVEHGTEPRIAMTPRGPHLLWYYQGTVLAAPLDKGTATLAGPEHAVTDGVMGDETSAYAEFAVADEGTLAFIPGPVFQDRGVLCWVGQDGASTPFADERLPFANPTFSRDGRRLCVTAQLAGSMHVFWHDASRGVMTQLTFDSDNPSAAISPDGESIVYASNAWGDYELLVQRLSDGHIERLGRFDHPMWLSWSPDGRYVLGGMRTGSRLNRELWVIDMADRTGARRLFASEHVHTSPQVSPNGRWVAYGSEESEPQEVYVRSFPGAEAKRQITTDGGHSPRWAPDGRFLYYVRADTIMKVPMSPEDGRPTGRPAVVAERKNGLGLGNTGLDYYTVAPDGRFLVVEPSEERPKISHIEVIVNWFEALR